MYATLSFVSKSTGRPELPMLRVVARQLIAIIVDPKEHKNFRSTRASTTGNKDQGEIDEACMEGLEGILFSIMAHYYDGRPWKKVSTSFAELNYIGKRRTDTVYPRSLWHSTREEMHCGRA